MNDQNHTPAAAATDWKALAILMALSVAVRLPLLPAFDMVSFDGTYYIKQARALWNASPQPGAFPLGYPFFISLFMFVIGDGVRAAQAVSFVASMGTLIVFFKLAQLYLARNMAFYATAALALSPVFIRLSMQSLSESPYIFWMLLALLLFEKRKDYTAGLAAGVAAITRPEMLGMFGVMLLCRLNKPRRLALLLLAFVLVYTLNPIGFYVANGEFSLLQKTSFFGARSQAWQAREATIDDSAAPDAPPVSTVLGNYAFDLSSDLYYLALQLGIVLLPLAALGWWRRRGNLAIAMTPLLIVPLFTVRAQPRYILPYVPIAILYGFVAVDQARETLRKRGGVILLLTVVLALAINSRYLLAPTGEGLSEMKEAGLRLADQVKPGDKLADRKPYVAFYSGAEYVEIPLAGYDQTLEYLTDHKVRYLSVHRSFRELRPVLMPLLDDFATIAGELRLRQVLSLPAGISVYERIRDHSPLYWVRMTNDPELPVRDPAWRPDGRVIAFAAGAGSGSDIYVVRTDTIDAEPRQIISGRAEERQPAWSADGRRLAFASDLKGNWDIFILDTETGGITQATTDEADDTQPYWINDDSEILFTSDRTGTRELWKILMTDARAGQITQDGPNEFASSSHDSKFVAWLSESRGLSIADVDGGNAWSAPYPRKPMFAPTWSPDNKYLAVTASDWGSIDTYLLTADGQRCLLLTKNFVFQKDVIFDGMPAWSPDGSHLAVVSNQDGAMSLYLLGGLESFTNRLEEPLQAYVFEDTTYDAGTEVRWRGDQP